METHINNSRQKFLVLPNSYLEKRHYKQGTISQIKIDDNNFVTSDKDILTECTSFYKSLYASKGDTTNRQAATCFFETENDTVLQEHEQKSCDGLLTKKECLEAIKSMESEKTPGTDGLPAEFYKMFWTDISTPLVNALNHAYETDQLSIMQKRGIIKLIPKKDAEPYFIIN